MERVNHSCTLVNTLKKSVPGEEHQTAKKLTAKSALVTRRSRIASLRRPALSACGLGFGDVGNGAASRTSKVAAGGLTISAAKRFTFCVSVARRREASSVTSASVWANHQTSAGVSALIWSATVTRLRFSNV